MLKHTHQLNHSNSSISAIVFSPQFVLIQWGWWYICISVSVHFPSVFWKSMPMSNQ